MSGIDTARLLLAGVPGAREVEYHEWTAAPPSCRGELRAAGEVLWFTYAGYEPQPVRELPNVDGAAVLIPTDAGLRTALRDCGGEWHYIDGSGYCVGVKGQWLGDWRHARVVPEDVVSLLRSITEAGKDRDIPDDEARDLMVTDAVEALKLAEGRE